MKIRRSFVLLSLVVGACGSSSGGGTGGAPGTGGMATGTAGSGGMTGNGAAGNGGMAGNGAAGNGGMAGNGAAGNGAAGNGAATCSCQGMWKAVQYACGTDAPAAIPTVTTFTFAISGTVGMFSQANVVGPISCTNSNNNGTVTCDGSTMAFDTGLTTCEPANCLSTGCDMPGPQLTFTFSQPTPATMTTVTPDTTPLTTCTSQGKSNPVTLYWEKQ